MDLRFPDAAPGAALYESVYAVLSPPEGDRALWVRTTVRKLPDEEPTGAVWVTWTSPDGVRAAKVGALPVQPGGHGIDVEDATQGPSGSSGRVDLPSLAARWDLRFTSDETLMRHLRPSWLYGAPLPRTKSTSPLPDLRVEGTLEVDGEPVDLTGWTGMLGHNWGTEHAARWIWLRAAGLGDDGRGWLDAVLARVRVGPVLTPWTGFGTLSLDGHRHALGGLGSRRTDVVLRPDGADVTLAGHGVRLTAAAGVDLRRTVGWRYADPGGGGHEVANCSVATVSLDLGGRTLTARSGVLEVGGDEIAFDVALQPFAD
ncbi:hypothetical protein [Nocardioides marmoribigeumensis]|uniref:Uncharacterized protein n=1 Tax=Nocardioides marmoribigeumensis TaxID=433649 RepID=A0ABU2BQZ0_9ACTN|nr:hypothetical protein [Nocardioides marmoribigeumensis]MDR7360681.1 hypothetical protein [Nocardioides marmoribigeumensis]